MKHDPEQTNKSEKLKRPNAQSALANYYDDLLGSIADDPLRHLNEKEMASTSSMPHSEIRKAEVKVAPAASRQQSKPATTATKTQYAERKHKPIITQVIIPAAFPKMAPDSADQADHESVREKLKRTVKPKTKEDLVTPPKPRVKEDLVQPIEQFRTTPEIQENVQVKAKPVQEKLETVTETKAKQEPPKARQASDRSVKPIVDTEDITKHATLEEHEVKEPESWLENGRPPWAQNRFDCLLFSVAGLKLAVPLISLGAIYQIEKEFTPLVGRASWFMGLYRSQDRNIQVVDTAKWVMPDRYHDQVRDGYNFIIRLGGNNWGMACDEVFEAIQLEPSQVKWRSERSKRPWLSGTVIDHMCALLDADTLGYLLQKDAKVH